MLDPLHLPHFFGGNADRCERLVSVLELLSVLHPSPSSALNVYAGGDAETITNGTSARPLDANSPQTLQSLGDESIIQVCSIYVLYMGTHIDFAFYMPCVFFVIS